MYLPYLRQLGRYLASLPKHQQVYGPPLVNKFVIDAIMGLIRIIEEIGSSARVDRHIEENPSPTRGFRYMYIESTRCLPTLFGLVRVFLAPNLYILQTTGLQ